MRKASSPVSLRNLLRWPPAFRRWYALRFPASLQPPLLLVCVVSTIAFACGRGAHRHTGAWGFDFGGPAGGQFNDGVGQVLVFDVVVTGGYANTVGRGENVAVS